MATAKRSKTSGSGKASGSNPKKAASSVANKKTAASKSGSAGSTKGGAKSATAKTGGANKSSAAKSAGASKTGASKTTSTAKKAGSKGGTAKSSTASARGGSKTSTGTKSGAAGKRTASGGAKQSAGRSNSGGSTKSKSAAGGSAKSASSRSTGKGTAAKAGASKPAKQANGSAGKKKSSSSKKSGNGILAKATDAIGSLFAAAKPNAINLLKSDHETVNGYFEEVKAAEDANHQETYKKIKFELDAHAHIEETIFYPYLMDKGDKELQKIVREGIEEHRQAKLFLAELGGLHGDNDRFKAKLQVLMEDVEHHVKEEENEMFPLVEEQIPQEKLESMGTQMEKEKARFQKMMSPPTEKAQRASARR